MSDSVRPRRPQPTRLLRPWDSPSKYTGVGCHFLLQRMEVKSESEVVQSSLTLVIPWAAACQAPLSMGFPMQEYWSGLPFPSPRYLPDPGIKPRSLALQMDSSLSEPPGKPIFSSVQLSCSVVSDSLRLHELQHARPPCPSPTPRVYKTSCPLSP